MPMWTFHKLPRFMKGFWRFLCRPPKALDELRIEGQHSIYYSQNCCLATDFPILKTKATGSSQNGEPRIPPPPFGFPFISLQQLSQHGVSSIARVWCIRVGAEAPPSSALWPARRASRTPRRSRRLGLDGAWTDTYVRLANQLIRPKRSAAAPPFHGLAANMEGVNKQRTVKTPIWMFPMAWLYCGLLWTPRTPISDRTLGHIWGGFSQETAQGFAQNWELGFAWGGAHPWFWL